MKYHMDQDASEMGTNRAAAPSAMDSDVRIGMQATALRQAVLDHLYYSVGRLPAVSGPEDYYRALALAIRDRMQHRWINTVQT
jgi:starch phosphorylase